MEKEYIFKGEEVEFKLENVSIGKYIFDKMLRKENEIAQIDETLKTAATYSKLRDRGMKVAELLRSDKISKNDVVLVCSSGNLDYTPVMLGTWWAGGILAPLDPSLQTKEMAHMLRIFQPRFIFCTQNAITVMVNALEELKITTNVICIDHQDSKSSESKNIIYFEEYIKKSPPVNKSRFAPYTCSDIHNEACLIMCSSGTTGLPKGVTISHATVQLLHVQARKTGTIQENSSTIILSTPLFWISGKFSLLMSIFEGSTLVILRTVTDEALLQAVEKYKPQYMMLSPATVVMMSKNPNVEKYNKESLITVLEGGAAVGKNTQQLLSRRLGVKVLEGYGATETFIISTVHEEDEELKEGYNCGMRLWDNVQVKIIDQNTGKSVGRNQTGEVISKSNSQMLGYYNNPEATKIVIDDDGWYHTGDIGYFNDLGNLIICDRIKEVVKYRGTHIAPAEIESVILSHPSVYDVGVIGIEHEVDGYHPMAFVVLKKGESATEEEIEKLVKGTLSSPKWLRGGVKFLDEIPRTTTGKIMRRSLRLLV